HPPPVNPPAPGEWPAKWRRERLAPPAGGPRLFPAALFGSGHLLRHFADRRFKRLLLAVAKDLEAERAPNRTCGDEARQVVYGFDLMPVRLGDHVAGFEARLRRGALGRNRGDQRAVRLFGIKAQALGDRRSYALDRDAEPAPGPMPMLF